MNSLSLIFLFHVLTGIHGKENWHCKDYIDMDKLFSCLYKYNHKKLQCIEIVKMAIYGAMNKTLTDGCLVKQSKLLCTDGDGNNKCKKKECRQVLSFAKESVRNQQNLKAKEKDSQNCDDDTGSQTDNIDNSMNGNENERRNDKNNKRKNGKEKLFKLGAIVGISVGITGTIILIFTILITIFVCRQRSKKKRKQQTRQLSINQRLEIENYESGAFSTDKGGYNVLSTNKPLNADEAQGEYFVLDPFITKYDKNLSNRKLPEITRFSGAEGDENVYYEIDEDKIKSSTDMGGVDQKKIEVINKGSYHSDQTRYEVQLGSIKKKREQLTKQQSVDQRSEIASLESNPFSTNNDTNTILFAYESLDTDKPQGEYFVLEPSITKYDKDLSSLVLPEIKRSSVAQGDERVNEIDEDELQPRTDMEGVRKKPIEEVKDKISDHGDQKIYESRGSTKNNREQLKRPQSVNQRTENAHLENSPSGTNKGGNVILSANDSLDTDEAQGEYFVLDPFVTKYDKDLSGRVLPDVKRFRVAQGDENVYNEIYEDTIESSTDMNKDQEKPIGEIGDIVICHSNQTNNEIQLGFDNTSYHVR
ncbi:uncharacterized protein LOC127707662 [Mytilus californianus]|uniref:uncharacterized protein LOC127707662 n=1 Tax=Mytilus californianus TaxID=6549 RepID=UPI002245C599|nr:uncharacterized protein LOC127707662 [Mytilus californianus]